MSLTDYNCCFDIDIDVPGKTFNRVTFRPIRRPLLSWREETVETARHIARSASGRKIFVCMSGGIDGEVMARAFTEAGVDFEVITLRHTQNTNEFDVIHAIDWCRSNGVRQHIVPFDVAEFFSSTIWRYIEAGYDAGSKTYLSYTSIYMMQIAESLDGAAVIGNGESRFITKNNATHMDFRLWWYNNITYMQNRQRLHFPWFFKTTPEMTAAYLEDNLIKLLTRDPSYFVCPPRADTEIDEKNLVYHKYYDDMRRRDKKTGWENIRQSIPNINIWLDKFHSRPLNMLERVEYIPVSVVRQQLGLSTEW